HRAAPTRRWHPRGARAHARPCAPMGNSWGPSSSLSGSRSEGWNRRAVAPPTLARLVLEDAPAIGAPDLEGVAAADEAGDVGDARMLRELLRQHDPPLAVEGELVRGGEYLGGVVVLGRILGVGLIDASDVVLHRRHVAALDAGMKIGAIGDDAEE